VLDQFDKCHFKNEIRRIGTAKQGEFIHSTGSINLPKPLGNLLVVPAASKTLLAVKNFSENGITTTFHSVQDGGKCDLSSGGKVFQSISPSANGLFYVSLQDLCKDYEQLHEELALLGEVNSSIPSVKGKRTASELREMCKYVMFLHRCLGHVHFRMLATGIRDGAIVNSGLEYKVPNIFSV